MSAMRHALAAAAFIWLFASGLQKLLPLSSSYPLKSLLLFAVGTLLLAPLLAGHPSGTFGAANRVTLLRALIVSLLGGFLGEEVSDAAAILIAGSGLGALALDGVDGYLARRNGLASEFGARFDMETDAALILLFSLLAWQMDKAGAWIVLAGLWRYLFIAAGVVLPWMRGELPASKRRQTVCVVQVVALLAVLLPVWSSPWTDAVAAAALLALTASFLIDVRWLARQRAPFNPTAERIS